MNPLVDLNPLTKVIKRQEESLYKIEDSIKEIKAEIGLQEPHIRKKRGAFDICPVQSPKLMGFLFVNEVYLRLIMSVGLVLFLFRI